MFFRLLCLNDCIYYLNVSCKLLNKRMYNLNVIMFAKSNGNPPRSETNIY